jgi:cbb3-type cytochrome oxidase subunit 3
MEHILVSAWTTVVLFAVFVGIVLWAWSSARSGAFEAAGRLPLEDDVYRRAECECGRDCPGRGCPK